MGREETRATLERHALRLFSERGFDAVTVEEIAQAAGVSHMTFFRHFPTKDAVLLDDPYDPLIGACVARQSADLPPLVRVAAGTLEAWAEAPPLDDEAVRTKLRIAASHSGLRARMWENTLRTQEVIVGALVEHGERPGRARVAAGAVLGALTAALLHWASDDEASLDACLRETLTVLAGDAEVAP